MLSVEGYGTAVTMLTVLKVQIILSSYVRMYTCVTIILQTQEGVEMLVSEGVAMMPKIWEYALSSLKMVLAHVTSLVTRERTAVRMQEQLVAFVSFLYIYNI